MQQIVVRLEVVEEDHGDTSSADVHDLACPKSARQRMKLGRKNTLLTILFAHSVTRSHSSLVVRLSAFPINGRGLGPGGNFLAVALWVRASTERVTTAPASVAANKSTVMIAR
jgi:hypothetical protein